MRLMRTDFPLERADMERRERFNEFLCIHQTYIFKTTFYHNHDLEKITYQISPCKAFLSLWRLNYKGNLEMLSLHYHALLFSDFLVQSAALSDDLVLHYLASPLLHKAE